MRVTRVLAGSLAGFLLIEILLFNTGYYASILSPDSSTGQLELRLRNEMLRPVADHNQILAIGDSRMGGFLPRFGNELKPALGYTFATIAMAGSTPRCWYYMLRAVDPGARRYAAIVVALNDFDDAETWDDHADYISDLHYLIARLRWNDLAGFSRSFHSPTLKWEAARGIFLKGLVYKTDVQDFLRNPVARIRYAAKAQRESRFWFYDFTGTTDSVKRVTIDWTTRTLQAPPGFAYASDFRSLFLDPRPPDTGRRSAYMKHWLGKICDLYRGSDTRIIFVRLPRGPFVRPDQAPFNAHSSARDLAAAQPNVILDQEHFFDSLESPELFFDAQHLNAPGSAEFSRMLARHVRDLLARPHQANAL
jgi:hypothetical protein